MLRLTKLQARALNLTSYNGSPCKRCLNTTRSASNGGCVVCAKAILPRAPSALEQILSAQIKAAGISDPLTEFRFHPVRRWRFDMAWPELKVAVEIEGGAWVGGRHTRGKGFEADLEKYDAAMRLGWNVYRCAGRLINNGQAVKTIEILLRIARETINPQSRGEE